MRSRTIIATPPGATIKEQLDDRGMTQKEFALRISFASAVGIDPGIVVGRLQNDGVINHNVLNELKTHYQLS